MSHRSVLARFSRLRHGLDRFPRALIVLQEGFGVNDTSAASRTDSPTTTTSSSRPTSITADGSPEIPYDDIEQAKLAMAT